MTDSHSPDWDDDELVPLGDLRPSREYFGPLPKAPDAHKGRPNPRLAQDSRQAKGRDRGARPARPQQGRPQQGRPQQESQPRRAEAPARRSEPQQRAARPRPSEAESMPRRARVTQPPAPQRSSERPQPRQAESRPRPAQREQPRQPTREPIREPQRRQRADHAPAAVKPTAGRLGALGKIGGNKLGGGKPKFDPREALRARVTDGTLAVFSRKGGVGKTTISAYLGMTLAAERGGRILAIDGDSEAGSLGWLLAPESAAMLAALSTAEPTPSDYASLREFTADSAEGLEVIVGDTDDVEPLDTAGLEDALVQIARNYDISIFDTGGTVSRTAGRVLVKHARVLLLVMGPSVDSVRAAERTLTWLEERPGEAADPNVKVIAVINGIPNNIKESHVERIEQHFASRCAAVVRIPWDEHLATGSTEASLDLLGKSTRRAFLDLAATSIRILAAAGNRQLQGARRAS